MSAARSRTAASSKARVAVDSEEVSDFRAAVMGLARRLRLERPDRTLGPSQISILSRLSRTGPLSAMALAYQEQLPASSVTRLIATLEAKGFVTRERDPEDLRRLIITITDVGQKIIEEDRRIRTHWLENGFLVLTDDEQRQLIAATELLDRIRTAPWQ
jgi:DNA-binding MarR family transcriptional regulator